MRRADADVSAAIFAWDNRVMKRLATVSITGLLALAGCGEGERLANRLETLSLDRLGRPGVPVVTPSSGTVPFGFGITDQGTLVVSEAGASTVSSFRADERGALRTVSASLPVGQGAAVRADRSPMPEPSPVGRR